MPRADAEKAQHHSAVLPDGEHGPPLLFEEPRVVVDGAGAPFGARSSGKSSFSSRASGSVRVLREQTAKGAHWLKGVCTCRCSPLASGLIVLGVFTMLATSTVVSHELAGMLRVKAPPSPPVPCGTWPDYRPCKRCAYGANASLRYRVQPGDTCESIGKLFGVPQFDIFIRNRSMGCCEAGDGGVRPTDLVDMCNPPTREQWREAGHPRTAPENGMILSFLGMQPQAHGFKSLPPPRHLSRSINVAVLYSVIDTDNSGTFRVSPKFTGNCTTFIDPTTGARHDGDDPDERVWLASLDIYAGLWDAGKSPISAEQWGINAARSLEQIILRYRLDGIDVNIEAQRSHFGAHICAMFRGLREIDPGMITTLTPWGRRWAQYSEVGSCKDDLSWANYQTYSDWNFNPCASAGHGQPQCSVPSSLNSAASTYGGFSKVAWGVSTESGNYRPRVESGVAFQQQLQGLHPELRGVMIWTSEFSSVCSPPWCYDDLLARAAAGQSIEQAEIENCKCDGKANPAGNG